MNDPAPLYWIGPLISSLAVAAVVLAVVVTVAAVALRRTYRELFDDLLELLTR